MFRRILIANRGEIAVRIIRTCRDLGIETVAVYSDADRRALHVLEADSAVYIGASPPGESYLRIDSIVQAAVESGTEALHPGYGLLSENPALAEACAEAGIIFIGPSPQAMRIMGDKSAARDFADSIGVPTIPGYHGEGQDIVLLQAEADKIGYPLMVKAAMGGGGRGMRLVESPKDLENAVEGGRREAERAFGDGRLLLERAVQDARHIEVQVLADNHGHVIFLGERDCSLQRRRQKIIEEAPSPALDDKLRRRIGTLAARGIQEAGYRNAGTVEFLLDKDRHFYFMEVNCRIQVEHGVTEMVTGLDLVKEQLRIACGEPLSVRQQDVHVSGHAVECRITSEDPARAFAPDSGVVSTFLPPGGPGVRVDTHCYTGYFTPPYYDSLLAKVITWGRDRHEALDRMERALRETRIEGVKTSIAYHLSLLADPYFRRGEVTIDFVANHLESWSAGQPSAADTSLAGVS